MNYTAAVKIAQKRAVLSDVEYRTLLERVAGVTSSKQLTETTYNRVLAELYHIADVNDKAAKASAQPVKSPAERKFWALWYSLMPMLPPPERTTAYLLGFVRRASGQTALPGLCDLRMLTPRQMYKTIEALKQRIAQEESAIQSTDSVPF